VVHERGREHCRGREKQQGGGNQPVHDGLRAAGQRNLRGHPGIADGGPDLGDHAEDQLQPGQPDQDGYDLQDREDVELMGEHRQARHIVRDRHTEDLDQAERNANRQCDQRHDSEQTGQNVSRGPAPADRWPLCSVNRRRHQHATP